MSKVVLYGLVLGVTYATLDKGVFHAGIGYTAEQVGDHLDDTNGNGDPYFAEVDESEIGEVNAQSNEVKIVRKSVTINRKPPAAETLIGDVDPDKVTV